MNELELLKTIDPEHDTPDDDRAAEQLLRSVLASPRPTRRRRRRALIALPVAAAVLAALLFAFGRGGESLAAKAYAATDPDGQIVHEISVMRFLQPSAPSEQKQESWWRPADGTARALWSGDGGTPTEMVIGADGIAHVRSPDAGRPDHVIDPDKVPPEARRILDSARSVTLGFRDVYEGRQLHDEGTTTLDGRTVHAYSVDTKEFVVEDEPNATIHRTFYLDPETARPVAARLEMPGPNGTKIVMLTVVTTYEKLPATPANLALLR